MGYDTDVVTGFALQADTDESAPQELVPVRTWAALARGGSILVSVEHLSAGGNVQYILAHETVHDVLLHTSQYGIAQLALATFDSPPFPPGVLATTSMRVLANLLGATRRLQESCATLVPAVQVSPEKREDYWAQVPAAYRDLVADLQWIVDLGLPKEVSKNLILALARYALGCAPPLSALLDPRATRQHLRDPRHNPQLRFEHAAGVLRGLSDGDLEAVAQAADGGAAVAQLAGVAFAEFSPTPPHPDWIPVWQERVWSLVSAWRGDARLTEAELGSLPESEDACLLRLPFPAPTVLKAALTHTVSAKMKRLPQPDLHALSQYPFALMRCNTVMPSVPAFDAVDVSNTQALAPEESSLWLYSPTEPVAAGAVLPMDQVVQYVAGAPETVTLCVSDLSYWFGRGDVIFSRPVLASRRHLVVLQHMSLGSLLGGPLLADGLAGETQLTVTVWDGKAPGAAYLLIRPTAARYPVVVAPAPLPTADLAAKNIEQFQAGLTWDLVPGDKFLEDDVLGQTDLLRFCMWFENEPWPEKFSWYGPQPAPAPESLAGGLRLPELGIELGPPPDARGCGGDFVERLPDSSRAVLDRIGPVEARGRVKKAAKLYARAMQEGTSTDRAAAGIALGFLQRSRGLLAEAADAFYEAGQLRDSELHALALLYLGELLISQAQSLGGRACLSAAAEAGSAAFSPLAVYQLALLLGGPADAEPARSLMRWVVASGHSDVAPLAEEWLRGGAT